MDRAVWISIAVFAGILGFFVLLRARNRAFEIKATDIVVAVLPIAIFLLVTGKIQKFEVGDLKINFAVGGSGRTEASPAERVGPLEPEHLSTAVDTSLRTALASLHASDLHRQRKW